MTMQQPEALLLAELIRLSGALPGSVSYDAASELRRLHTENQDLRTRHYCNTAEIESLRARVQELGEMARENRSKKVIELERRIAEMEEQMAAIGAGGVEPLRKRAATVSDEHIKAVLLANGFTIKEGMTDLKPYVYQAARALLAAGGQAQAVERIAIDMKQTAELLDLFGGEPTEFTVMQCNGPSGPGLYAYVTEYPEDGASYLGKTDCEAQPAPQALSDAQDTNRWMGIGKAIERACADLPEETEIIVSLEKDAGTVTMIDQHGNEHENFSCDYGFAGVLNEAIDAAIAAQAKNGGAQQ